MKNNKKIKELKENYNNIEIPTELDKVIEDSFKEVDKMKNKKKTRHNMKKWCASAAALGIIFVSVNVNSSFANSLEEIPVIGNIIKIININNYRINHNGYDISINVPNIRGTDSKDLEYKLNKEFEEEGKAEYKKYEAEVRELEKTGKTAHKYAKIWYDVINDNENILSVARYNEEIEASSYTTRKIYNIDKKDKTVLSLEGMFENNDYVDVISKNILKQMHERTEKNPEDAYFVDSNFKIKKDQNFYINNKNELVICFDQCEIAPASSGTIEFIIPSNIVNSLMK